MMIPANTLTAGVSNLGIAEFAKNQLSKSVKTLTDDSDSGKK